MSLTQLDQLGMAFRKLSRRQLGIIELRIMDDCGFRDIGNHYHISKDSAQRIYEKTLARLRRELK